jgi:hypothetical protein
MKTQGNETTRKNRGGEWGKCVGNNKMNFREIECGYFHIYFGKFPALSVFLHDKEERLML